MNVDQALKIFRDDVEDPREALQWSLDHWDECSGRLLSKLRAIAAQLALDGEDESYDNTDGLALFYLVHLFAEKRDTRAYGPLCDRLMREKDSHDWLGDSVTVSLVGVLIALCDGDLEPIQRVIENPRVNELVRGAALEAYSYLVRFQNASNEEAARVYLRRLYEEAEPRGQSWLWVAWMEAAARLGFQDFGSLAARLLSKNWTSDNEMSMQDFNALFAKVRTSPEAAFAEDGIEPFKSTIALVNSVAESKEHGEEEIDGDGGGGATEGPHVNPMRDVGRNDPCPCGSGKKYKKCCLAA